MALVEIADHDGVRVLSLARPPVNAIDLALIGALDEVLADAVASRACRALVVTGRATVFSAGIDTKAVPAYDAHTRAEMLRTINRTIHALYGCPKPTVAAINGHALGGGLVVALACDARIVATGAHRLGLTEVTAGIPFPAVPMVVVTSELGPNAARRLVLSGATFEATASLATFVDETCPGDQLLAVAIARATALAAAPGYAAVKAQLRGEALARMQRIVDEDDDPMLRVWA
jgi:enoyl-CoA hydratase